VGTDSCVWSFGITTGDGRVVAVGCGMISVGTGVRVGKLSGSLQARIRIMSEARKAIFFMIYPFLSINDK
jgi:hypothetical protein